MGEYYTREINRLKRERKHIDRAISDFERLGEKGIKTPDRNGLTTNLIQMKKRHRAS